jgi:hypothetical protein
MHSAESVGLGSSSTFAALATSDRIGASQPLALSDKTT